MIEMGGRRDLGEKGAGRLGGEGWSRQAECYSVEERREKCKDVSGERSFSDASWERAGVGRGSEGWAFEKEDFFLRWPGLAEKRGRAKGERYL